MNHQGPWRSPVEETVGLYPGLVVHDGRQTGSITVGRSRLPVWAFVVDLVHSGWPVVVEDFAPLEDGFDAEDMAGFLYHLCDARGEFGRLLLVMANAERLEGEAEQAMKLPAAWWHDPDLSRPVADQLRRCLAVLEEEAT